MNLKQMWLANTFAVIRRFPVPVFWQLVYIAVWIEQSALYGLVWGKYEPFLALSSAVAASWLAATIASLWSEEKASAHTRWLLPALVSSVIFALCLGVDDRWWIQGFFIPGLAMMLIAWPAFARWWRAEPDDLWSWSWGTATATIAGIIASCLVALAFFVLLKLIDALFGFKSPDIVFDLIAGICVGFVAQSFLLGGLTSDKDSLPAQKILRAIAVWICVPFALAYLAIFYAYMIWIIATGVLPVDTVAWMTVGIASFGTVTWYLSARWRADGNRLIELYNRHFFTATLPVLGLFAYSIIERTGEFGWTEPRLFLVVIGAWLLICVVGGWLLWHQEERRLALPPSSLALILLVVALSPFTPRDLGVHSQSARLEVLIEQSAIQPLNEAQSKSIRSIMKYLITSGAEDQVRTALELGNAWPGDRYANEAVEESLAKAEIPLELQARPSMRTRNFELPDRFNSGFAYILDGGTFITVPSLYRRGPYAPALMSGDGRLELEMLETNEIVVRQEALDIRIDFTALAKQTLADDHLQPGAVVQSGDGRAAFYVTKINIKPPSLPDRDPLIENLRGLLVIKAQP